MNRADTLAALHARIRAAAGGRNVTLVAASKSQPASAIGELAAAGQRQFGENYVQEALAKQGELQDIALEWHMIGPLQSNKCELVARHFGWLQSLDREKLVPLLDRARPSSLPPLNVLIEVNIDGESSKSGCTPDRIPALAETIMRANRLRLRGLMAIPAPSTEPGTRHAAFARLHGLFESLHAAYPRVDTLSMGMSDDFESAIAEGATMVRLGTALFGPRRPR